MIIGIPKEIMKQEGRIGITPEGVKILVEAGHQIIIEKQAGEKSGLQDQDFLAAGSSIKNDPKEIYQADMVVKVKEPQENEYQFLKDGGIIFAFLHLPPNPKLARVLMEKGMTGIAYEGVQLENGKRPLLQPMSEIAGERAIQEGVFYLKKNPKDIVVAVLGGGGVVGQAATKTARALGATVIALDLPGKLPLAQSDSYRMKISTPENICQAIKEADLLIGAVAIPGKKAEKLVSREMLSLMKKGAVIVDVAIDEGGCTETCHPTELDKPTFVEEGIIHYCVKNIPGAVPKKSTPALTKATFPYIIEIANKGLEKAIKDNAALAKGVHIYKGKITNQKLAETIREEYIPLETLLENK